MSNLELKKRFAVLYKPSAKLPMIVDVPSLRFLMIDGTGHVGGLAYQDAVRALHGLAYPVKFEAKKRLGLTYPVMPLEGLFGDPREREPLPVADPWAHAWRLLILLPDEVTAEFVDEVRAKVAAKKCVPRLEDVRVQTFSEGISVQLLHVGPYSDEALTIERLMAFAAKKHLSITGCHHEIYLSDPCKTDTARRKKVLRFGVTQKRS